MTTSLANQLLDFYKNAPRPLALHEPSFTGNEWQYIKNCLDSGWVSSAGSYVEKFERDLGAYTESFATTTVNGTSALHLCLIVAGVKPDDEVLVPSLTFVATANAVSYCKAIPHFVEAESLTFGVCPKKLHAYLKNITQKDTNGLINSKTGRPIKALIVTHLFGMPAQLDELVNLCTQYNLILIEDAAESLGSFYKGRHTGTFGKLAALSFNGNKIITTGGGGAVLTQDKTLAARVKHLSTTARITDPYRHHHDEVGFNYRMPNLNAALGCAQMEKIDSLISTKKALAQKYKSLFESANDISFLQEPDNTKVNFWLNTITLATPEDCNNLIERLNQNNIQSRGVWAPMHELPMYKNCPRMDCSEASRLTACSINLPSSADLLDKLG